MRARRTLPARRESEIFDYRHDGIGYTASVSRFADGSLAEIFLDCDRRGSAAETSARDCAVLASLCLQYGVPVNTIRHALVRLADGSGAGALGAAFDRVQP